jgi:hypothetical protein
LYAIGEVILIFIGVFAATRVELWRQRQSDNQQIIEALQSMKYDVQYDTSRLNSLIINRYDLKMNGLFSLKEYIEHPYKVNDTLVFLNRVAKGAMFSYWYNPKRTAYGQLANLGLIYKIEDNSLRSQIIEYYDAEEYSTFALKTESDYIDIINSLRPAYQRRDSLTKADQKYMMKYLATEANSMKRSINKEISHGYTMLRLAIDEKEKGTKILLLIDEYIRKQD